MKWLLKCHPGIIASLERREVEGQGLVEYALIIVLMILAVLVGLTAMGNAIISKLWFVISQVLIPAMGG